MPAPLLGYFLSSIHAFVSVMCFVLFLQCLWYALMDFHQLLSVLLVCRVGCAEPDENVGYQFSKNRTEPTSKFKNRKLGFRGSVFKNRLRQFGDGFSRCLIHNSYCGM